MDKKIVEQNRSTEDKFEKLRAEFESMAAMQSKKIAEQEKKIKELSEVQETLVGWNHPGFRVLLGDTFNLL